MVEPITPPQILVIDDDPTIVKLVATVLAAKGYRVLSAQEAPCGLEMAMKQLPNLIILDVMMPIINGFNICRLLKNQDRCRHIPIILLTSRSADEDRHIGEEVGADAYISKPFNTQELLDMINALLNRSSQKV